MGKIKEVKPTGINDSLENIKNYHLDVVSIRMTVSAYANMRDTLDEGQLRNALKIIHEQLQGLEKYSS